MRLAKLTLNGFKSFADKTEFTFDQEVTGIVGPNGCGKSNVVDAIKWVLGERSSKSLRGTEMLDVIFAGSAGRKPSGMAAVSLTFENPVIEGLEPRAAHPAEHPSPDTSEPRNDAALESAETGDGVESEVSVLETHVRGKRILPIDADVVEVERRLYRDGASKYLINGRPARLRDIRDLFLDTGIGADAYSIIEQGKVDAMLLASPQERRTIFEEAAGVAKYKQRRIEAQRKLEKTESNLTQTRSQLESTDRRLRIVRGQAAKARKFQSLDSELAAWRVALAFDQYDDLRTRLDSLTSRQAELESGRAAAAAELAEAEDRRQHVELARQELLEQAGALEQSRLSAEHQRQQSAQRRAMAERSLDEARRQAEIDEQRLARAKEQSISTEASIADQRETAAGLAERLAESERLLRTAGESRAAILEEINDLQSSINERRSRVGQIERERASLQGSLAGDDRRAESLREQIERITSRAGELDRESTASDAARQTLALSIDQARAEVARLESMLAEQDRQIQAMAVGRRERAGRISDLGQELVRLESRRATLEEMAAAGVGYGQTVREIMSRHSTGKGFAGVLGPVAELIESDAPMASAVESALGATLQAVVVRSLDALPAADELASLPGRATFLPMDHASVRFTPRAAADASGSGDPERARRGANVPIEVAPRVQSLRASVRVRSDTVRSDDAAALDALLDRVLGSTYLVESLDAALMLSVGNVISRGARFVTRDGTVLEPDGRVIAGPTSTNEDAGGVLQRRNEATALRASIEQLGASLADEQSRLAEIDTDAAAMSAIAGDLRARLAAEQRRVVQEQSKLDRATDELARLARDRGQCEREVSQVRERLEKLDADRARLRERVESLRRLHDEQAGELREIEERLSAIRVRAESAAEQCSAAKVEVSTRSEQLNTCRREASRLELLRDELARAIRDLTQQVSHAQSRREEHRRVIDESTELHSRAEQAAAEISHRLEAAKVSLRSAEGDVAACARRVQAARSSSEAVERDWHGLEIARRELEVKREAMEDRTQEELRIDLAWEHAEYREMMSVGDVARIDPSQAEALIAELREAIRKLGSVNIDAIAEEDQLASANDRLIAQVADLDSAAAQLRSLIERLNDVSKSRFAEVFAKIQEHFGSEDGMFRKLFGGGKAEVRLMPLVKEIDGQKVVTDEIDVLESGVEVVAKPPGKEPRSISQLSGGEKTLTAVALLMSIFRSKPSCFCVLDEVDAALDESNVARFGNVVRQFTDLSHFIVITHNKRTMQQADRLYGVTMQERGVSKRVSVKFEQVGKDGHIVGGAATTADADPHNTAINAAGSRNHTAAIEPEPAAKSKNATLRRALAAMREEPAKVEL